MKAIHHSDKRLSLYDNNWEFICDLRYRSIEMLLKKYVLVITSPSQIVERPDSIARCAKGYTAYEVIERWQNP